MKTILIILALSLASCEKQKPLIFGSPEWVEVMTGGK